MDTVEYRSLQANDIRRALFAHFTRRQDVTECWRKVGGEWRIQNAPFIDDWSETDYGVLVACLQNTIQTGGFVMGAFLGGVLKGFVSVEAEPLGSRGQYRALSSLHVSRELRGQGLGRRLFTAARCWAGQQGAEKLYISSHSAVETQSFYRAMGCVEAKEYDENHAEAEPFDCQLECCVERP